VSCAVARFSPAHGSLEESTAIQQRGERIGRRGHLVEVHRPILCQRQDDESGTHDIKHDFDREHGDPAAGGTAGGVSRCRKGGERHRHEKDCPMQDVDEHRRPAPNERLAAFAPQFAGGRERIAGDDERTHQDACSGRIGKCRGIAGDQPESGAEEHRRPEHRPAMKQARGAPDHADGNKQQDIAEPGRRLRSKQVTEPPQRSGESADQIRHSPPRQRLDAFLAPCKQQEQAKQHSDTDRDDEQRPDINRYR
jgi:hypothetical protein